MLQPIVDRTIESYKTNDSISGIDEFLAIISHELRNPTNAILGWTELLGRQIHHPGLAKAIDVIRRNALVQAQLLDELVDYSRLGANTLALKIRVVSLKQIVKAAAEALTPMALQKQIHLGVQPAFQRLKWMEIPRAYNRCFLTCSRMRSSSRQAEEV